MRVKVAAQCGQSFDFGSTGTFPLCNLIFDAVPSFLRSIDDAEGPAMFWGASGSSELALLRSMDKMRRERGVALVVVVAVQSVRLQDIIQAPTKLLIPPTRAGT